MHYFQFEVKEWIANTAHLSLEEECAYFRLILYYYDSEQAFNGCSTGKIFRKCRIPTEVGMRILDEFFKYEKDTDLWVHSRCDEEIARYKTKQEQASKAGKASVQARLNKRSTDVQPIINHKSLTINQIKSNPIAPKVAIPIGVSELVWNDFLTLRKTKKMAVTLTALKGIAREAEKANKPLEEVLSICCERGWAGFKAEWIKDAHKAQELPLGSDQQIEYAYRVECNGDPSKARFNSYNEMRKFIIDQREKRSKANV